MYTIWFRLPFTNVQLHVDVEASRDVKLAQSVWDKLFQNFEMVSARP
jgi:hypothetical protein